MEKTISSTTCDQLRDISSLPLSSEYLALLAPSALSVDTTNMCNLRCKHCFWNSYHEILPSLTNPNILHSVQEALRKYPTITNITWYGGEPLLSEETTAMVQNGVKLRKNNLIITNGTFFIPQWDGNIHFAVSIDGTKNIHDELRGVGTYDKIKINVRSAIARKIPVAIIYCLNAINIHCIQDFLKEWADEGTIGVVFTAYAPIKNKPSCLALDNETRSYAVSKLLDMKQRYGKLICNTTQMIELISGEYGKMLASNCLMDVHNRKSRVYSIHMCNDGSIRLPCALGKDADCLECRSVTQLALHAGIIMKDKSSLFALFRMYHSKPHGRDKDSFAMPLSKENLTQ